MRPSRNSASKPPHGRDRPSFAARCLAVLLAASVVLVSTRAQAQSLVRLAVQDIDGSCRVIALPKDRADQLQHFLTSRGEELVEKAQNSFDRMAETRFANARERVPSFGDWTYGWFESYVLSLRLVIQLYTTIKRGFSEGWPSDFTAALLDDLATPVRDAFKQNMTQAGVDVESHLRDLGQVAGALDADWRNIVGELRAQLAQSPTMPGSATHRISFASPTTGFGDGLLASAPRTTDDMVDTIRSDATLAFQAMRPIVPRLGTFLLRISELGGLIFTIAIVGFALGGILGFVAGAVLGLAIYWLIDWVFNRTDAYLNQMAFERAVLDVIDQAQARLSENAGKTFRNLLVQRLALISPSPGSCP
jgi:hypothetical protein